MFITPFNVHSKFRTPFFTTSNFKPAGLIFMVEHTHSKDPQHMGVVWWGSTKQRLDGLGWKWIAGLSTRVHLPLCPLQYKIWLYNYTLESPSPTLGAKSVTNTFLYLPQVHWGYNQTLIWSLLALGLEMGISYATQIHMGFINETERNHWMTLNTAFIHITTSITATQHTESSSQYMVWQPFVSRYHITISV